MQFTTVSPDVHAPHWGQTQVGRRALGRGARQPIIDLAANVAVLAGLWATYALVRSVTQGDFATAAHNANTVIDVQQALGLPSESMLQSAFLEHSGLIRFSNLYYLVVHFPLTVLFLGWAWRNNRTRFARVRNALVVTTVVGLLVHLAYPLLPPRMMHGFVDTAKTIGPDPYELGISGGANQFAAMPSLHVGWALLVAAGFVWLSSARWRWLALAHPAITFVVVVITANHYWVDAIVAAAIVAAAWVATARPTRPVPRLRQLRHKRDSRRRTGHDDASPVSNSGRAVALRKHVGQLAIAG